MIVVHPDADFLNHITGVLREVCGVTGTVVYLLEVLTNIINMKLFKIIENHLISANDSYVDLSCLILHCSMSWKNLT